MKSIHPTTARNNLETAARVILDCTHEDVTREGLKGTPARFALSMLKLTEGYLMDPKTILSAQFSDVNDLVISKGIPFYSLCEHHLLPFFGTVSIAYLPHKKVIGISKLARLLDVFARRLQIQERIGEQVTAALMKYLQPKGAACIIEATHMCMRMRGVNKQESVMSTSSLKGVFLKEASARQELFQLIKG